MNDERVPEVIYEMTVKMPDGTTWTSCEIKVPAQRWSDPSWDRALWVGNRAMERIERAWEARSYHATI